MQGEDLTRKRLAHQGEQALAHLQEEALAQLGDQTLAQQGGQTLALQGGKLISPGKYLLSVFSFSISFLFMQAR